MTEGFDTTFNYMLADTIPKIKLTQGHLDLFEGYSQTMSKDTFSKDPVNKLKATSAINALYSLKGLKPPHIVWTKSPTASIFANIIRDGLIGQNPENRSWDILDFNPKIAWGEYRKARGEVDGPSLYPTEGGYTASVEDLRYYFIHMNQEAFAAAFTGDLQRSSVWDRYRSLVKSNLGDAAQGQLRSCERDMLYFNSSLNADSNEVRNLSEKIWKALCESIVRGLGISPSNSFDDISSQSLYMLLGKIDANNAGALQGQIEKSSIVDFVKQSLKGLKNLEIHYTLVRSFGQFRLSYLSEYLSFYEAGFFPKD